MPPPWPSRACVAVPPLGWVGVARRPASLRQVTAHLRSSLLGPALPDTASNSHPQSPMLPAPTRKGTLGWGYSWPFVAQGDIYSLTQSPRGDGGYMKCSPPGMQTGLSMLQKTLNIC